MNGSPLMQYVQLLNEVKGYLRLANKRLVFPLMEGIDDAEHTLICEAWSSAVIKPFDEKFKLLTSRGYKNSQDCMDALEDLKAFKRRVVNVLEG
jgi:hypothetical protein